VRIALPTGRDLEFVIDIVDARGRPSCSLSLVALRPGADPPSQDYPVPVNLDIDAFAIQFGGALQGILDLHLEVRRSDHGLEANRIDHTGYTRKVLNSVFGGRPLEFPVHLALQSEEASLRRHLNPIVGHLTWLSPLLL
jgi:hypothetical protein